MESNFHEVYNDVEKAIDYAFNGQFVLKFYDYLKIRGTKKVEVEKFIESATAAEINNLVIDLDEYLEGGSDEMHKQLREGYGHIPKPQASMFAWAPIPEKYKGKGSLEFAKELMLKADVAVAPGVAFGEYGEGYVRVGLVENEQRIRQAAKNIKKLLL